MKNLPFKALILFGLLFTCASPNDWTLQAATPVEEDECSEEIIISYFPSPFVKNTLQTYKVPEREWDGIISALKDKNKEILKYVEDKAATMNPNPLKDPKSRNEAIAIFKEALMNAFKSVMAKHGVNDDKQLQEMLDDIQKQKAKRFSECLEKHMKSIKEGQ